MKKDRGTNRMMNVKVPIQVCDAIDKLASATGASKTEVVIALLNEGLAVSESTLKGWRDKNGAKRSKR